MNDFRRFGGCAELVPEEAPQEYRELIEEYFRAWDAIFVRTLEEHGEHEMAQLFRMDRDEFDQRVESGRQFFFGPLTTSSLQNG